MLKRIFVALLLILGAFLPLQAQLRPSPDTVHTERGDMIIQPIRHATVVLEWNDKTVYVDPVQHEEMFAGLPAPDIILVTDVHGDHYNLETYDALNTINSAFVVPRAVANRLSTTSFMDQVTILENGEKVQIKGVPIRAMPMYNLPQSQDARHPKGRGNGYVFTLGGQKIYISGDTEGIPEMRNLQDIDVAFVCMNLPYTMDVKQAADAVLDFAPDIVYPYHHRGQDIREFKRLVNAGNADIEVRLLNWYPDADRE